MQRPIADQHPLLALVVCLALLVASSKCSLKMSWTGVPVTAQTLALALICYYATAQVAVATTTTFLALAVSGVPVGAPKARATRGYVVGFVLASAVVPAMLGQTAPALSRRVAAFCVGDALVLALGSAYYWWHTGKGIAHSVLPFLPGDALKIAAACVITGHFPRPS